MRTNVVDFEIFEAMKKRTFDNILSELQEATKHLSSVAGKNLTINSVNDQYVLFNVEENNNLLLKADYHFTDRDTIKFNNFEKIVIDESSKTEQRKSVIRNLLNSLQEDDNFELSSLWNRLRPQYSLNELAKRKAARSCYSNIGGGDPACAHNADEEDQCAKGKVRTKKGDSRGDGGFSGPGKPFKGELMDLSAVDDSLEEMVNFLPNYKNIKNYLLESARKVAEIVCEENTGVVKVTFKESDNKVKFFGKSKKKRKLEDIKKDKKFSKKSMEDDLESDDNEEDNNKEVDEVEIDKQDKKDDKKKMSLKSKKFREKVNNSRKKMARKEYDETYINDLVSIKKYTNAQDSGSLQEKFMEMITNYPEIVFVSCDELTEMNKRILKKSGEKNWNEELCYDISLGLRKLAHKTYSDNVYEIAKFAANDDVVGLEEEVSNDPYQAFEQVSERYFNDIYKKADNQYKSLMDLSEMLQRTAITLESDAKSHGLYDRNVQRVVAEYNQFSSQISASAHGQLNENVVQMVVGSLLSKVSNDYSLNKGKLFVDPGHYRGSMDLDGEDYKKHASGGTKRSVVGDEEISMGNPMSPNFKTSNDLDLEQTPKSKDYRVMKYGIHTNPMAPNAKSANDLDLS